MPRVARFTLPSLAELTRQLRYAPPDTRAKQMDAAESFAVELEMDQLYPEDFVIYRITGYKPQIENPALLLGEALIGDLAGFVQHVSDGLELPADYRGRRALDMGEVASKLQVSGKTLSRYRKQGLICHYVVFSPNVQRLACFEDSLTRFVKRHHSQVSKAKSYSRIDEDTTLAILDHARSLRHTERMSLNEAALAIAMQHGRAHETIRMMLQKHDRYANEPIFSERAPLTERDGQVLHRAWRWCVPVSAMAERYHRTPTTIARTINRRRSTLLRRLELGFISLPTFTRDDAADVILGVGVVSESLDQLLPHDDAMALLEAAKPQLQLGEVPIALLSAYNFLKHRSARAIEDLNIWPGASVLDAIETDLRWASRIKSRLVSIGLPTTFSRLEQHMHRPLIELPAEHIIKAIRAAVAIVAHAVESIDPAKGEFTRMIAHISDRELARNQGLTRAQGRATAKHPTGSISLANPFVNLTPWESFLEPRVGLSDMTYHLRDTWACSMIRKRYGWDGTRPRTITELSASENTTSSAMSRMLSKVEAQLLSLLRVQNKNPTGH